MKLRRSRLDRRRTSCLMKNVTKLRYTWPTTKSYRQSFLRELKIRISSGHNSQLELDEIKMRHVLQVCENNLIETSRPRRRPSSRAVTSFDLSCTPDIPVSTVNKSNERFSALARSESSVQRGGASLSAQGAFSRPSHNSHKIRSDG